MRHDDEWMGPALDRDARRPDDRRASARALADLELAWLLASAEPRDPGSRWCITRAGIEVGGLDVVLRPAITTVRRHVPLPLVASAAVGLAVIGVASAMASAVHRIDPGPPVVATAMTFLALETVLRVTHELGHAVAFGLRGARIGPAGFACYWSLPTVYFETTGGPSPTIPWRLWQAAGGLLAEAAVVGLLVLASLVVPGSHLLVAPAGVLLLTSVVLHVVPVLGRDGSWFAEELKDRPDRVVDDVCSTSAVALRVLDRFAGLVAIVVSVWLWLVLWGGTIGPLWHTSLVGGVVAVIAVVPALVDRIAAFAALVADRT